MGRDSCQVLCLLLIHTACTACVSLTTSWLYLHKSFLPLFLKLDSFKKAKASHLFENWNCSRKASCVLILLTQLLISLVFLKGRWTERQNTHPNTSSVTEALSGLRASNLALSLSAQEIDETLQS